MSPIKVAGLVLIVAGALMLGYGSFSYTKEDTAVKIGPIELSVKEKKTVNFPVWVSCPPNFVFQGPMVSIDT